MGSSMLIIVRKISFFYRVRAPTSCGIFQVGEQTREWLVTYTVVCRRKTIVIETFSAQWQKNGRIPEISFINKTSTNNPFSTKKQYSIGIVYHQASWHLFYMLQISPLCPLPYVHWKWLSWTKISFHFCQVLGRRRIYTNRPKGRRSYLIYMQILTRWTLNKTDYKIITRANYHCSLQAEYAWYLHFWHCIIPDYLNVFLNKAICLDKQMRPNFDPRGIIFMTF
jgi:hypothetical protein